MKMKLRANDRALNRARHRALHIAGRYFSAVFSEEGAAGFSFDALARSVSLKSLTRV